MVLRVNSSASNSGRLLTAPIYVEDARAFLGPFSRRQTKLPPRYVGVSLSLFCIFCIISTTLSINYSGTIRVAILRNLRHSMQFRDTLVRVGDFSHFRGNLMQTIHTLVCLLRESRPGFVRTVSRTNALVLWFLWYGSSEKQKERVVPF